MAAKNVQKKTMAAGDLEAVYQALNRVQAIIEFDLDGMGSLEEYRLPDTSEMIAQYFLIFKPSNNLPGNTGFKIL